MHQTSQFYLPVRLGQWQVVEWVWLPRFYGRFSLSRRGRHAVDGETHPYMHPEDLCLDVRGETVGDSGRGRERNTLFKGTKKSCTRDGFEATMIGTQDRC